MVEAPDATAAPAVETRPSLSPFRLGLLSQLRRPQVVLAAAFLTVVVVACLFGPLLLPGAAREQNLPLGASPPQASHWFGTDVLGRDQLARMMEGGRISLGVGICAALVSLVIGVLYGGIAGFVGGRLDAVMMRAVDVTYALPFPVLVILLMVIFGRSFFLLFVAIGAIEWLTTARIVRAQVMAVRRNQYILASRALGAGSARIFFKGILPNISGPVIAYTTLNVSSIILLESFLSFLGLGAQPPLSSWGTLIKEGAELMEIHPWLLLFPASFFTATLLAINIVGDALRDAFQPSNLR
jgi:oligopeptide transport system permease protein